MEGTASFMAERGRLVRIASRILGDPGEAEDVVQQAWIRLDSAGPVDNVPAWLTTVTTRLCLDQLRARLPLPVDDLEIAEGTGDDLPDPAEDFALAETVGIALHVVLDRLTPAERISFVLHDTFSFDFTTIASLLDTSPAAARKLASRARAKVALPQASDQIPDWAVVDAFLSAARNGDFERLIQLLSPDAAIAADGEAVAAGTPERIIGQQEVASFFNGAAKAALPALIEGRPGAAWFDRGTPRVAFDFTIANGAVTVITFRAHPHVLANISRRIGPEHTTDRTESQ